MKLPKLFNADRYEIVGAGIAILIVGPIFWMAMDQSPPLEIVSADAVSKAPVPRLGSLKIDYRAIYLRADCSGEGQRKFVDISRRPIWTEPYDFRTGIGFDGKPVRLHKLLSLPPVSATVPQDTAPGPTTYANEVRFFCNPLQKLLGKRWPWFSIVPPTRPIKFFVSAAIADHPIPSTHIFGSVESRALDQEGNGP